MKITKLNIIKWRAFNNIEINIPKESTLIALIGENGVGKSSILDIVNTAAHHLGLASGVDIPRGNPFNDEHEIKIDFYINPNIKIELRDSTWKKIAADFNFDGEILFISQNTKGNHTHNVFIKNLPYDRLNTEISDGIINSLRSNKDTFHLSLDADRAYPPRPIQAHEYVQSLDQDWEDIQFKKHRSHYSSRNKYDEWMKFCVGTEAKKATESYQLQRQALTNGTEAPSFIDHFESYGKSVNKVLPHLQFLGVDTKEKTLIFDSTGSKLTFNQLSGGEREIAFVVGQIRRFELENGLLLIDEPELHLNPDMVRTWISYLRDSVKDGQTWIATHSMEAVEAAGLECTFVVERNLDTKKIDKVIALNEQPALSILSAAVGSPAFSISKKAFVFIEGDRQGVERDKFYRLLGLIDSATNIRFMEGGGCYEVVRKFEACNILAESADQQLNVGAIVDKDFRCDEEILQLTNMGVFVLPFHEIENAFLYPPALEKILLDVNLGITAQKLIQKLSDKLAGKWILDRAKYTSNVKLKNPRELNTIWANIAWDSLKGLDTNSSLFDEINCENDNEKTTFIKEIIFSKNKYKEIRETSELWAECEGKQIFSLLSSELGFSKKISLLNTICAHLKTNKAICETIFSKTKEYIYRNIK